MGFIGFVFKSFNFFNDLSLKDFISKNFNVEINYKLTEIVVFYEDLSIINNYIIGFDNLSNNYLEKIESNDLLFLFLDDNFNFLNFFLLNIKFNLNDFDSIKSEFNFRFGKISLSNRKNIDFEYNLFWFDVHNYKDLYYLMEIKNIDLDLKERFFRVVNYFKRIK